MATKSSRLLGIYKDRGKIQLENGKMVEWHQLSTEAPPLLPYGAATELTIVYEEPEYLHGAEGIVWATYDFKQAETVQGALQAQHIACELREKNLADARLYLLRVPEPQKVEAAIDFIWRDTNGLRLKPDWWYPAGATNESFQRWINEVI